MKEDNLTIIVPVYNECDSIKETVTQLLALNEQSGMEAKIIVVDDGSDDGTGKLLKDSFDGKVVIATHGKNKGYGASIKTGMKMADTTFIAITDADGTYPNEKITDMYKIILSKRLDMVVGARRGDEVYIPIVRKPAKYILNSFANYLSGEKIPDLNSGLRVMRTDVIKEYINILPEGFSFTTTITLALIMNGHRVEFFPINYFERSGYSKIRPIRDTIHFFLLVIRTSLYFNPIKVFFPLSAILLMTGIAINIIAWLSFGILLDVTLGIFSMTAVTVFAIGLLADLIDKRIK